MSATASIVVQKSMSYKGGTKVWSNRYHLTNDAPSGSGPWTTLSDAIVTAEKAVFYPNVVIVGTLGYAAGSEVPVFSKTYSTAGTGSFGSAYQMPGNCVALVRYDTDIRTSKNHPVYLFNYYHGAARATTGDLDALVSGQKTALTTYANAWVAGFSDGTLTHKRAGPNGAVAQGSFVATYLTHRDFRD